MDSPDYMRFSFMSHGKGPIPRIGKRVAVIGYGPSGLAVAGYIASKGYEIIVYERLPAHANDSARICDY